MLEFTSVIKGALIALTQKNFLALLTLLVSRRPDKPKKHNQGIKGIKERFDASRG
jgi:hypothetical protein